MRGYAFLTSSSGRGAQESDRIRASFFTHYLVTGLRGAADVNLDGKVTLGEAYEFAFHETLAQTEGTRGGAASELRHALTGTGDLVLTDLRGTSAGIVLDRALQGRLFVRSSTGALVAELQKQPGRKVELGLEPGLYDLGLDQGNAYHRSLLQVEALTHHPVALKDFAPAPRERNRERGSEAARDFDASPEPDSRSLPRRRGRRGFRPGRPSTLPWAIPAAGRAPGPITSPSTSSPGKHG